MALLTIITIGATAQFNYNLDWIKPIGGTLGHKGLYGLDRWHNKLLMSGYILNADTAVGCDILLDSMQYGVSGNGLLLVTDLNGNKLWGRCYGGSRGDVFKKAAFDARGNIWAAGYFASFDGDFPNTGYANRVAIIKFDSLGVPIWNKFYGSVGDNGFTDIIATSDGGALFTEDFNYDGGDIPKKYGNSPFTTDTWLCKLDSSGSIQWSQVLGGSGNEKSTKIKETEPGRYTVLINTTSTDSMLTGLNFNDTSFTGWFIELNALGHILKSKVITNIVTKVGIEKLEDFVKVSSTEILAVGDAQPKTGDYCYPGLGDNDFMIGKMDSNYRRDWCMIKGGQRDDYLLQIRPAMDGFFALGGWGYSTTNDLVACDSFYLAYTKQHAWIALLKPLTQQIFWEKTVCGSGSDEFSALLYDTVENSIYVLLNGNSTDGDFTGVAPNDSGNNYLLKYTLTPLGIKDQMEFNSAIHVYPNPAGSECMLETDDDMNMSSAAIYDGVGRQIVSLFNKQQLSNFNFNCASLSSGLYFIEVRDRWGDSHILKLIKE